MMMGNKRMAVASGAAHFLPVEMMTEVFLRLPVKSIVRFRTVCQSWNALLSSDEFCCLHMARAEAEPVPRNLFFTSPTVGFDATAVCLSSSSGPDDGLLFTLDDVCGGDFIQMTPAPCRGLTLLHDPFAPAYYVFNASTRAVTRLPPCHNAAYVTAGLGFDARTKKYKVVRLFLGDYGDKQHIKCEIYTLGGDHGNIWRPPATGVPFRFCRAAVAAIDHARWDKLLPVFANGCLHWLLCPSFVVKRPRAAILSFSVTDETFAWVRSPPFTASGVHLVELAGHLCMVRDLRHVGVLEIWKLNDFNSGGWSLEHHIDLLQHVGRDDLIKPEIIRVIGSVGSCGSTKRIVIATSKRKVIVYDPMSQTLEETFIAIRDTHSSYQAENLALTSISLLQESLVPVPQTNEERALLAPLAKAAREILLRLPADCTMRCKLVCRQWLSLIEGNSFMLSYHSHNNMDKRPKIMLVGKGITRDRITIGSGFSFTPCPKLLQRARRHEIWLDTKVVCSKPCHGMNLLSTEQMDYLYNPCTGFRQAYYTRGTGSIHVPPNIPSWSIPEGHGHAFTLGRKNVGLGFNLSTQDHVIVEMFYHVKDFKSRRYFLTCIVSECRRGSVRDCLPPPLPVSDMPPAYLAGVLYWMTDPRLGESDTWAIVSFEIARSEFGVIPCLPCIATWNCGSASLAFVVELEETLCVVLADPDAEELSIWKRENGKWHSAYKVYLEGWPGYSLGANVVVPWAINPKDGKILLNTGRKLGSYDPASRFIENLYDLEEVLRVRSTEQSSYIGFPENLRIAKCKHDVEKFCSEKSRLVQHKVSDDPSPALSGNSSACSSGEQCLERRNSLHTEIIPLVPILYEESLTNYPRKRKSRVLLDISASQFDNTSPSMYNVLSY